MSNIALYVVKNGEFDVTYLYSHWGASTLTAGLRVQQAMDFQNLNDHANESLGDIMAHLGYEGEYIPDGQTQLPNTNRIFEKIEADRAKELVWSVHRGENTVQAIVEIDQDSGFITYTENPSLRGETYAFFYELKVFAKKAQRFYSSNEHRVDVVQDFADMSRNFRNELLGETSDYSVREHHRSEVDARNFVIHADSRYVEMIRIDRENSTFESRYVEGLNDITEMMQSEDGINHYMLCHNTASSINGRFDEQELYNSIDLMPCDFRCVLGLPFMEDRYNELRNLIVDRIFGGCQRKLLLLNIENSTPMLRVLPVRYGEDIYEVTASALDRGEGVELRMIRGRSPDIVGFINANDAGKRGNPVVLANGDNQHGDGYYLSESQITRLQQEFGQLVQQPMQQQRQQNSQEQSSARRRR